MAYSITLKSPDGEETTFECAEDENILDAAEEAGVDHPSSAFSPRGAKMFGYDGALHRSRLNTL